MTWQGRTSGEGTPRDGETDFIIAHPMYGLLLIEVKGGGISYIGTQQQWTSTDRNGDIHPIDNPFRQAERLKEILLYWSNKEKWEVALGATLITDLKRLHAPTIRLPNPLALQIEDEEREILRLTEEQTRLLDFLSRTRQAAISGCAGTGKTMLAIEKAARLAREGFRTLLTCFNKQLAVHLSQVAESLVNLHVCTFHQLCYQLAREAGITPPNNSDKQQLFDVEYPAALCQAVTECPELRFDAIIVDEGQDFKALWWLGLEECLIDKKAGIFYVFFDDNQRIYRDSDPIPSDLPLFTLRENVRNTRSIHHSLFCESEKTCTISCHMNLLFFEKTDYARWAWQIQQVADSTSG